MRSDPPPEVKSCDECRGCRGRCQDCSRYDRMTPQEREQYHNNSAISRFLGRPLWERPDLLRKH